MKYDLFKVRAFENLNHTELSKQLRMSLKKNEKLSASDLALITEHKINFNITNVGNFPAEIKSVSISDYGSSYNGFKVLNTSHGYDITYSPNFKTSRVNEILTVKTKYSVYEFTVHAYIPMYLIRYIDDHFRVTEIEEKIGNWYYLILLLFVLFVFGLLGAEILSYINYVKQRGYRYEALQRMHQEYLEEHRAKAEDKVVMLERFIEENYIKKAQNVHEAIFDGYASATICYDTNCASNEVKKLLAIKLDPDDDSVSSTSSNQPRFEKPVKQVPTKQSPSKQKGHFGGNKVHQKHEQAQRLEVGESVQPVQEQKSKQGKQKGGKKKAKDQNVDSRPKVENKPKKLEQNTKKLNEKDKSVIDNKTQAPNTHHHDTVKANTKIENKQDKNKPQNTPVENNKTTTLKPRKDKNKPEKGSRKTSENENKDQKQVNKQKNVKSKKTKPQKLNTEIKKDEVSKSNPTKDVVVKEKAKESEPKSNVQVTEGKELKSNITEEKNKAEVKKAPESVLVHGESAQKEVKVKQNIQEPKGKPPQYKSKDQKTSKAKNKNEPKMQNLKQIGQCKSRDNLLINEVIESHHRDSVNTDDTKIEYQEVSENRPSNASKQSKASDLHSDMQSISQHSNEDSSDQKQTEISDQKHYNSSEIYSDEQEHDYHKEETSKQYFDKNKDPGTTEYRHMKPSSYQDYKKSRKMDSRKTGNRGGYGQYSNYPYKSRRNAYNTGKHYENPNYKRNYKRSYYYDKYQNRDPHYNPDKYKDQQQEEYYENEFYKTNYNKQGYYDFKYDSYADRQYDHKDAKEHKPSENKTRSNEEYQQFVEDQFYEEQTDIPHKTNPDKHMHDHFDEEKFYDDIEEDKMDMQHDQDEEYKEEPQIQQKETFFSDADFKSNPYSVFNAFGGTNQDFSLFAPIQESANQEEQNPLHFDFMDDSSARDIKNQSDDLLYNFDNLQELREKSEAFDYDLAKEKSTSRARNKNF